MQIDIREKEADKIERIIFADPVSLDSGYVLNLNFDPNGLTVIESEDSFVFIDSKEDALNLIKALQKAIELGNWE